MTELAGLDVSSIVAPALGLGASGALLAVRGTALQRQVPVVAPPLAPRRVLAALLLAAVLALAVASGTPAGAVLRWILALVAMAGSFASAWTAGQLWRHSELLRLARPCTVDDALGRIRDSSGRWLLVEGRLGAPGEVTSPGGVVCAFFDAELRLPGERGEPGRLVARERGASAPLELRGLRRSVRVRFAQGRAAAPVSIRRVLVPIEADVGEVPAEGARGAVEVLSWESVGKLGAPALALGRLVQDARGRWQLVGLAGGPAPLVLSSEREPAAEAWRAEAWSWAGVALPLAALAALCFGGSL